MFTLSDIFLKLGGNWDATVCHQHPKIEPGLASTPASAPARRFGSQHLSHSLNSVKGVVYRLIWGTTIGVSKGILRRPWHGSFGVKSLQGLEGISICNSTPSALNPLP